MLSDRRYKTDCDGKVRHYSEGAAVAHLEALKKKVDCRDADTLHVYACPFGAEIFLPHFHVGHKEKG